MKEILYLLAKNGKLKVDVSRYVTLRFGLVNYKIRVFIDNHFKSDDGNWVNNKKYVHELKTCQDLEGYLDIKEVQEKVKNEYNKHLAFTKNSEEARIDILSYIQWDNNTNDEQKELATRIINTVAVNERVQISPNKYLTLANFCNKGVANEFEEVHFQLVELKKEKNGTITKEFPDLCTEQVYSTLRQSIKNYFVQIEKYLIPKEEKIQKDKENTLVNYEFLSHRYFQKNIEQEKIDTL